MSSELSTLLASKSHHAKISPEGLELLGKEAANMFLSKGISLNEGVAKLAGAYPDINHEQIKRICEFANTDVYLAKHDKSKTAGADASYPQFQLADAARVIQDMSDGARPTVVTPTDADYGQQPLKKTKVSSTRSDELLEELFGMKEARTREVLTFTKESAVREVTDARDVLIGLRDTLSSSGETVDLAYKEASAGYYETVKRHLLNGNGFEDVLIAARSSGVDKEKISHTLFPVVTQLLKEKVSTADVLKEAVKGMDKVAHRVINEDHPLVTLFKTVIALDGEIDKIASGLEQTEGELKKVNGFIRSYFQEKILAGQAR